MSTKPGYTTTEFWLTLLTTASGAASVLDPSLHVNPYVKTASVVLAGVASIAYTFARKGLKAAALELEGDVNVVVHNNSTVADTASAA